MTKRAEYFERHRSLLFSIAYRMLGSVAEAEDVVQEAYLRWREVPETEVRSPKSYLSAVVTRLSINWLRSARVRREEYVGPWLPEPLPSDQTENFIAGPSELDESLSMAFLVLLESLNPVERAVFLLREVFDYDYEEISRIVEKSGASCRQIARRARQSVAARRPRFERSPEQEERLTWEFLEACTSGDMEGLVGMLSEDVTLWSDGGGKVAAAPYPIHGPERVARFLLGVLRMVPPGFYARPARINGGPGVVGYVDGHPTSVRARGLGRTPQGRTDRRQPGEAAGDTTLLTPLASGAPDERESEMARFRAVSGGGAGALGYFACGLLRRRLDEVG